MNARIDALWLYPIKGCRGFTVRTATLAQTGLEVAGIGDREWVVVDDQGEFLSQRELPKMAQIKTRLTGESLRLKAPGMLQLDVPFESEGEVLKVRVWNDEVGAVTQGAIADAWFSQFLGLSCRLMRFDPEATRISNRKYTGAVTAPYKFADAFSLLVCSTASLADLNGRLRAKGGAEVTIERFRPNVDPATGEAGFEPGDTLATYRNDAQAGGITFGVNAVVESGAATHLSTGDAVEVSLRF